MGHDVSARVLGHSRGDWQSSLQGHRVVEVGLVVFEVVRGVAGVLLAVRVEPEPGRPVTGSTGEDAGLCLQDSWPLIGNPRLGGQVALMERAPGRRLQVLEHVHEIAGDV
jgi:hypothetical protein